MHCKLIDIQFVRLTSPILSAPPVHGTRLPARPGSGVVLSVGIVRSSVGIAFSRACKILPV